LLPNLRLSTPRFALTVPIQQQLLCDITDAEMKKGAEAPFDVQVAKRDQNA
jgi:hypothetical protein